MNRIRRTIVWMVLSLMVMPTVVAQSVSTQGKDFWLSYMQNGYYENNSGSITEGMIPQLTVSAKRTCSVTVTNPHYPNWSLDFTVQANGIVQQNLPKEYCYHQSSDNETVQHKGVHIVATDTISVYCANIANYSFDASFVLPTHGLGDSYIIQCGDQSQLTNVNQQYQLDNQTSAFLILAVEDNTTVHITPTVVTMGGYAAGSTFVVTLNAGETYHVRSNNNTNHRDLSGTRIQADDCKKIAVFNGNTITRLPVEYNSTSNTGFDHIFEQAMPTRSWGKRFVVTQSMSRRRDFVKIISAANGNHISKNGFNIATLDAYESHVIEITSTEGSCYLEATQPCAVYLYNTSAIDDRFDGDPSMVWIAPIEQRIDEVTFATFTHAQANIPNHYVNIIVNTDDINSVTLDGTILSPLEFRHVNGNTEYSYARRSISHGTHHISCPNGFNAHVYGFGDAKGYAYLVGSNAIDLSTNLTVNNLEVNGGDLFPYCVEEPVTFSAEVNFEEYDLLWDFGDGTTSTQNPTTHTYHEKNLFQASLIVTTDESGCESSAHDTTTFFIDLSQQYITENDEICMGQFYSGHGFNNVLILNDTILGRETANAVNPECRDSLLVYIHALPTYHVPLTDSRCWTGEPGVYDGHGFSFMYDHVGTYEQQLNLHSIQGCDSIVTLTLTVADQITYDFDQHECGNSYTWDGRIYYEDGDYDWPYISTGGCDSIVTLHLYFEESYTREIDTTVCDSFIWDGDEYTSSGNYTKSFATMAGCDSTVTVHLTINHAYHAEPVFVDTCDRYVWFGDTLTHSDLYTRVMTGNNDCDSILYLDLTIHYSPNPSDIYPADTANHAPHWVITATEFQINSYEFYIYDTIGEPWDSVKWEFEDPSVPWLLERDTEPFLGKKCRMYVLNYIPDTINLIATPYNSCDVIGKCPQRYWFVCSFYGMGENNRQPEIDITPNPNSGDMSIHFGEMEGRVEASVYDMQGQIVDRFSLMVTPQSHHSYLLRGKKDGIYLFVFNYNNHIITKKIILTR